MKKIIALILALAMLTALAACGKKNEENGGETEGELNEWELLGVTEEGFNSLKGFRDVMLKDGSLLGVTYLGCYENREELLIAFLNRQKYWDELIFLVDVDPKNMVEKEGNELYTIVPAEGVTVKVYEANMKGDKIEKGKELYSRDDSKPFFLLGNVSDIIPSFIVTAQYGDRTVEYSPCLSLKDGKVSVTVDGVTDITPYRYMTDFIYSEE